MIKKKKNNNPLLGSVYAIKLADNTFTIGQLCYLYEIDGCYSVAMAFFSHKFKRQDELFKAYKNIDLTNPFAVFSVTSIPNEWVIIGQYEIIYSNFNMQAHIISAWGWIDNAERDMNWILEMYFGIYPWDAFADNKFMDKLLLPNHTKPIFARNKSDFSADELKKLQII